MENPPCPRCGLPVPEGPIYTDVLAAPPEIKAAAPRYCSTACAHAASYKRHLETGHCAECGSSMPRSDGPGRPRKFCSEECRRVRERRVARAWKMLGKGVDALPRSTTDRDAPAALEALRAAGDDLRALNAELRDRAERPAPDVVERLREVLSEANQRALFCERIIAAAERTAARQRKLEADAKGVREWAKRRKRETADAVSAGARQMGVDL